MTTLTRYVAVKGIVKLSKTRRSFLWYNTYNYPTNINILNGGIFKNAATKNLNDDGNELIQGKKSELCIKTLGE